MGVMTNIEVGDIVEVHGYDYAPVWNGARLKVVEVHEGYYKGSVSGSVLGMKDFGSILGVETSRALFHTDNLRKVEDEAPEEPSTEKPVKATVWVHLRDDQFSPHNYAVEFESEEEFEAYQQNPFTELDVKRWRDEYVYTTTKFLRLPHKTGTALIDPADLRQLKIERYESE